MSRHSSLQETIDSIRDLLTMRSIRAPRKAQLLEALDDYERRNVDFIDAYNALDARRRRVANVCSYDEDFDRLGVDRRVPEDL